MDRDALVSQDSRYRYWLSRIWDWSKPILVFVMLNPSTADAHVDDQTIKRICYFAAREGYGGVWVVNLYAFRSTFPAELQMATDPFGRDNPRHLLYVMQAARFFGTKVVCAWGAHEAAEEPAAYFRNHAAYHRVTLWCLGKTKNGSPKHPCRLPNSTQMEVYRGSV